MASGLRHRGGLRRVRRPGRAWPARQRGRPVRRGHGRRQRERRQRPPRHGLVPARPARPGHGDPADRAAARGRGGRGDPAEPRRRGRRRPVAAAARGPVRGGRRPGRGAGRGPARDRARPGAAKPRSPYREPVLWRLHMRQRAAGAPPVRHRGLLGRVPGAAPGLAGCHRRGLRRRAAGLRCGRPDRHGSLVGRGRQPAAADAPARRGQCGGDARARRGRRVVRAARGGRHRRRLDGHRRGQRPGVHRDRRDRRLALGRTCPGHPEHRRRTSWPRPLPRCWAPWSGRAATRSGFAAVAVFPLAAIVVTPVAAEDRDAGSAAERERERVSVPPARP